MAKLKGLQLAEFSIVHGDDHRPANPEATALVFKAAQKEGEGEMQKATTIPAAEPPRTLAQKIGDAVRNVMGETQKAVQTRTSTSESRYIEQFDDGRSSTVVQNPDGSVSVTVTQAEGEAEPVVVQQAVAVTDGAVITKAVTDAIAPLQQSINSFDSRLARLEGTSVGSGQIIKSTAILPSTIVKFSD